MNDKLQRIWKGTLISLIIVGSIPVWIWLFVELPGWRVVLCPALLIILLGVLWWIPKWQIWLLKAHITDKQKIAELENSYRATLVQIFGGVLLLTGLYATLRTVSISQMTLELSQKGQIADRFAKAAGQLSALGSNGTPFLTVRLCGIYSLEQIAKDSEEYYEPVINLFATYIREHASMLPQTTTTPNKNKLREDLQTILTIIAKKDRTNRGKLLKLDLQNICLRNANFGNAHLGNTDFSYSDLSEVEFGNASIAYSSFSNANLCSAYFGPGREIAPIVLNRAFNLEDHLRGNDSSPTFTWCNFDGADLRRACLIGTKFTGTSLKGVDFEGATLKRVHFENSNLDGAKGIKCTQIIDAKIQSTVFPEYLNDCERFNIR